MHIPTKHDLAKALRSLTILILDALAASIDLTLLHFKAATHKAIELSISQTLCGVDTTYVFLTYGSFFSKIKKDSCIKLIQKYYFYFLITL